MTDDVMKRAARAMIIHNRAERPTSRSISFPKVWIVGHHIWFAEHCADEWIEQVDTPYKKEVFTYPEAYAFARIDKELRKYIY